MIRFTKVLAVASALLALPSMAMAFGLNVVGVSGAGADGLLGPGETVTFDVRIDWTGVPSDVTGVSANVTGYDLPDVSGLRQLGLALASGSSVDQALNTLFVPGNPASALPNGVPNLNGGVPIEEWASRPLNPQAWSTSLFGGFFAPTDPVTVAPGDGSGDVGIGGDLISNDDVHFQVTFVNVFPVSQGTPAVADLSFDLTLLDASGAQIQGSSDGFQLTMVPEPGTALLMGLGLAGLATIRRR